MRTAPCRRSFSSSQFAWQEQWRPHRPRTLICIALCHIGNTGSTPSTGPRRRVLLSIRRAMQSESSGAGKSPSMGRSMTARHHVKLSSAARPQRPDTRRQGHRRRSPVSITEAARKNPSCCVAPGPRARRARPATGLAGPNPRRPLRTHSSPSIRCSSLICRGGAPASSSRTCPRCASGQGVQRDHHGELEKGPQRRGGRVCSFLVTTSHPADVQDLITNSAMPAIDLGSLRTWAPHAAAWCPLARPGPSGQPMTKAALDLNGSAGRRTGDGSSD